MIPNVAKADKWRFAIGDMPSAEGEKVDLRLFDQYITTFTLPDMTVDNISSFFAGREMMNMNPNRNQGLFPFTITMKVSEGFENYWWFMKWWYQLRRGSVENRNGVPAPYMNFITHCTAWLLDTQKRERLRIRLLDVCLTSISSLTMVSGTSEELDFTISLTAQDLEFDYIGVNDGQSSDDKAHPSEWEGARTEVNAI